MTRTSWRLGLAAGALALAVLSKGDALVLAALVGLVAWRPLPALGVVAALVATAWRWASSSLADIAGAQAALGSAGLVGPSRAALGSWLGGIALLAAAPACRDRLARVVGAAAVGATAAAVLFGPAPGGDLWQRVVAGIVATVLALALGHLRRRDRSARAVLDVVGVAAGAGALVAIGGTAGAWSGTIATASLGEGVAVALAAGGVAVAGRLVWVAMEQGRG